MKILLHLKFRTSVLLLGFYILNERLENICTQANVRPIIYYPAIVKHSVLLNKPL